MTPREVQTLRAAMLIAGNGLNTVGASLFAVYYLVVLPAPETDFIPLPVAIGLALLYVAVAALTAQRSASRFAAPVYTWLQERRPATRAERQRALDLPVAFAHITLRRWIFAAVLFGALAITESWSLAFELAAAGTLSALTMAAATFLVAERVLRPVTALALDAKAPPEGPLGVGRRLLLAWALCSGIPILMIALIPVGRDYERAEDLIAPTMFVAACALAAGFFATKLATGRVATPLRELREAAEAVAEGDLSVRVPVDDASEVGRLQAGFNAMVAGLAEREHLRDLIDRSVGREVAAEALERGASLGGEVQVVSALFADVVGSTKLAARESPEAVVELLNRFFAILVEVVERHGGSVNKFEGDGALCLFGAPVAQSDHAARCLAAARDLRSALDADGTPDVAIGVGCGEAVAGWIGAESRLEYTVIGDPVNEAARLTELAKHRPERLLASSDTLEAAGEPEASHWEVGDEVLLRGRDRPTRLASPRPSGGAGTAAAARRASG